MLHIQNWEINIQSKTRLDGLKQKLNHLESTKNDDMACFLIHIVIIATSDKDKIVVKALYREGS